MLSALEAPLGADVSGATGKDKQWNLARPLSGPFAPVKGFVRKSIT